MTKKQKAKFIVEQLNKLYPNPPIPLDHKDTYTLLIAVLLSAQCTDKRVNLVTPLLFNKADNPLSMSLLNVQEIEKIIKPCGLSPFKSKAIHQLSEILVTKYNSIVPSSFEELESLPGVGHKTASVILSQAFNIPTFPVDTHIHRLLTRWGISEGKNVSQTEKEAKEIFPKKTWNKLHLQIIYYGREYSPARSPKKDKDFITLEIGTKNAQLELQ
ncbi:MAG: endonuclease III [Flavobacteriia bacterium]|nr:endonuclease III [Flavobacteriia bacterium]